MCRLKPFKPTLLWWANFNLGINGHIRLSAIRLSILCNFRLVISRTLFEAENAAWALGAGGEVVIDQGLVDKGGPNELGGLVFHRCWASVWGDQ